MATRIELSKFIALNGESKQTVADKSFRKLRTIYNWLNDMSATYLVYYDARSNRVLRVERREIRRVDKIKGER